MPASLSPGSGQQPNVGRGLHLGGKFFQFAKLISPHISDVWPAFLRFIFSLLPGPRAQPLAWKHPFLAGKLSPALGILIGKRPDVRQENAKCRGRACTLCCLSFTAGLQNPSCPQLQCFSLLFLWAQTPQGWQPLRGAPWGFSLFQQLSLALPAL